MARDFNQKLTSAARMVRREAEAEKSPLERQRLLSLAGVLDAEARVQGQRAEDREYLRRAPYALPRELA